MILLPFLAAAGWFGPVSSCNSPPDRRPWPALVADSSLTFGAFGRVHIYRQSPHPSRVILFVSGDGGWNLGVVDMARALAGMDAMVLGIDIRRYLRAMESGKEACSYPAADFEALSEYAQEQLGFEHYVSPVLVGYSSGATLVYAVLVEAPPGTFKGAISLGFCPDLPLRRPLCEGSGLAFQPGPKGQGYSFQPAAALQSPWIALQGDIDQVCNADSVRAFVRGTRGAEAVMLPGVGHGFSVTANWLPQFRAAFERVAMAPSLNQPATAAGIRDLPLVELPARGHRRGILGIILSGDGGWAGLDRQIAEVLADSGISVVGLDSKQYFWTQRTPDGTTQDIVRVMRHYLAEWALDTVIVAGYSRGADVAPFVAARLPADLRDRVSLVALVGPEQRANFHFHTLDLLFDRHRADDIAIAPEIAKLRGLRVLCIYGTEETDTVCPSLPPGSALVRPIVGGHHMGGSYRDMAVMILEQLR